MKADSIKPVFMPAQEKDIDDIVEIINFYYKSYDEPYGFLAGFRDYGRVLRNLDNYYTARSAERILGCVQISHGLPEEFGSLEWYGNGISNRLKKLEQSGKVIYIELIAVRNGLCNLGLGKFLYNNLFELFKDHAFLSSVIVKPYRNAHSLSFHKACGFTESAYYSNDVIGGTRYESVYLTKLP